MTEIFCKSKPSPACFLAIGLLQWLPPFYLIGWWTTLWVHGHSCDHMCPSKTLVLAISKEVILAHHCKSIIRHGNFRRSI